MKNRLICIFVILSLVLSGISVVAEYTPGKTIQELELSEGEMNLEMNKEQIIDVALEFDALSVTVIYEAENDTNLTLKTDRSENILALSATNTEGVIKLAPEIRSGAQRISLLADQEIKIKGLTFNKVNYYPLSERLRQVVNYTDYEAAIQDVVAISTENSVLKVNGALRYVDYDDVTAHAMVLDSRIYIPVKTFARAFSLYFEDYNDLNNYVYLSNDSFELYCSSHNGSYYTLNGSKNSIKNPVIYIGGCAYLPVRYVAELMGKTVGYRDGIAVIGNELYVQNVIDNETIFDELKAEISDFEISKNKPGKVYYVSQKSGNDKNPGSEANPFKTIQKAANVAEAGDTVIIKEGVYREMVTPQNDGNKFAPIIYKAADGEKVVISAMESITGFKKSSGQIYYADIPKSLGKGRNFVIIQNEAVIEGRHPNSDTHKTAKIYTTDDTDFNRTLYPTVGDLIVTEEDVTNNRFKLVSTNDLGQEADFWKGATVVSMHAGGWTLSTGEVIESEPGSVVVSDVNPDNYGFAYYSKKPYANDFGYITNHINTVDSCGEWYIDEAQNKIYMIPPQGTSGENLVIELKQRQTVIDLTGKSYIQFKDINTIGGGITMKDSTMCVINGGEHKYISHFTLNTSPHIGALGTSNTDSTAPQTKGEIGEYISGKNNAFVNAVINGSAGAGIYSAGAYSYIDNNVVLNTDYAGIYPSGITLEGERWHTDNIVRGGHTVTSNTVKYAGRSCFYNSQNTRVVDGVTTVFPTVANDICYNEFGRGCLISRDGGVVYEHGVVGGNDLKQTAFHHNIVYDHLMQPASDTYSFHMGIYRDAHVVFEKCYSNIYLNTDEDPDFAGKIKTREKAYFIQNASTGISYAEDFNNMFLTYRKNGQKDLVVSDYPGGRMFLAGVNREGRFLHNIEQTAMNKTILADDFVLEKGSVIENGTVKMQNRGDSIVSDSVYMSPGTKQVKMSFNGDKYDVSVYCFNLEVINNDNVVFTKSMYISGGGSALTDIAEKTLYIPQDVFDGGNVKLRLQAKDDNCLTFTKLVIDDYTGDIPEDFFPDGARILTAGEATVIKTDPVLQFMRNIHQTDEFRNNSIAKIGNTTLSYTVTTDKINAVQVMMSTSLAHSNGRLLIYDENETLLCVIDLKEEYLKSHGEKTEWLRINAKREFLTELPAGEHTIKLVFKRNSGEVFAPDFNNIAFYKTSD